MHVTAAAEIEASTRLVPTVHSAADSDSAVWPESVPSAWEHLLCQHPFVPSLHPCTPSRLTVPTEASMHGTAAAMAVSATGVVGPESVVPSAWSHVLSTPPLVPTLPSTPTRFTIPTHASAYGTAAAAVSDVGVWPESVPSGHLFGAMSHRRTVTGSPAALMHNNNQVDPLEHFATIEEPLHNDWTLYPHQERAVLTALQTKRHMLALAMGSGKTLIGCVWARQMRNALSTMKRKYLAEVPTKIKIIVLCPVSLQAEWRRTAQDATGLTIQEKSTPIDSDTAVAIASWAKVPHISDVGDQDYVVVADEAHFMQNSDSKRTEKALELMLGPRAVGVLLLTVRMLTGYRETLRVILTTVSSPRAFTYP
jgi:hypothetical protein